MSAEQKILQANMFACAQRIAKLRQSVKKTQELFPLTIDRAAALLSNKFARHYPDQSKSRVDRLILVIDASNHIVKVFESIMAYLRRKGLTT